MGQSANAVVEHDVDFCVVGGGMAGLTAAVTAARHGARVLLMQDRPVLGGNASSECRVHICGADVHHFNLHMRETGLLEENTPGQRVPQSQSQLLGLGRPALREGAVSAES